MTLLSPPPATDRLRRAGAVALLAAGALFAVPLAAQRVQRPGGEGTAGVRPGGAPPPSERPTRATGRRRAGAAADSMRSLRVAGVVFDSLAGAPLAGATVQWAHESERDRTYTTETDSTGRYALPAVRLGRYMVGFFHPSVDALGRRPAAGAGRAGRRLCGAVRPRDAGERRAPSGAVRQQRAGAAHRRRVARRSASPGTGGGGHHRRGAGRRLGRAGAGGARGGDVDRAADRGRRVRGDDRAQRAASVPARARADGGFVACGLPSGVDLEVSADAPKRQSGLVEVRLEPGRLVRRDFALGDSASVVTVTLPDTAAAREGRLAMRSRWRAGRPSSAAWCARPAARRSPTRASAWPAPTSSGHDLAQRRRSCLRASPAGTYSLEVRALGYAPRAWREPLARRGRRRWPSRSTDRINQLESVGGAGRPHEAGEGLHGFTERAKRGWLRTVHHRGRDEPPLAVRP
jgi:hypothetical protein